MFRRLISFVFVFSIFFIILVTPVRADTNTYQIFTYNNNQAPQENSLLEDTFVQSAIDEAKITAGAISGGAIACYGINGVATTVFPPAASLLPYCPAVGAFIGNGGINKTVKVAKHIPVKKGAKILGRTTIKVAKHIPIKKGAKILGRTTIRALKKTLE